MKSDNDLLVSKFKEIGLENDSLRIQLKENKKKVNNFIYWKDEYWEA